MKPKFIDHIVIVVKDIKRTEWFYSKFLGEPIRVGKEQVVYQVGDTKTFFVLPYGSYKKYDKDKVGLNHVAFGVKNKAELRSVENKLNLAGIKNSGVKIDKYGGMEFIWFDDPDGYRLEFYLRKTS